MKDKTKQIDTIIKTFALLNLLLKDNADFTEVLKAISNNDTLLTSDNGTYNVMLSKYLNTLKLFGLDVKKEKGQYKLINPPYKLELSTSELNIFNTIKECAKNFQTAENKDLEKFIEAFELCYSEQTQILNESIKNTNKQSLDFYYKELTDKIDICTKICNEDYKVEIVYTDENTKELIKTLVKTKNLVYRNGIIKLEFLDLKRNEVQSIALDKIINIKQNPEKSISIFIHNKTVVYGLKGRLAKNYTLRPWETSNGKGGEWTIIINKNEPEDELMKRLLKYGDQCIVYTPHIFREKIHNKIKKTLALYEND